MAEMLAEIQGAFYIERTSTHDVPSIRKCKKAIKKAFEYQMQGKGFSLVEILSICPTNWGFSPVDSLKWLSENMIPQYPLGIKKEGRQDA